MSFVPNSIERCCGSGFPQPVNQEDELRARNLVQVVNEINCVRPGGPSLPAIEYRNSTADGDLVHHVFRFDLRDYSEIFRTGFRARPQGDTPDHVYYNLVEHVNEGGAPLVPERNTPPRAFISTTLSPSLSCRYTNPVGTVVYRYEIYAPGGIQVDVTLADRYEYPGQREIAFVGGIAPQYVRGAQLFIITGYDARGFPRLERSIPMDPANILSLFFNPQSHAERLVRIRNPTWYYRDRENRNAPLKIVIYRGPQQQAAPQRQKRSISSIEHWYTSEVFDLKSFIDAAFRSTRHNEAYLFMKNEYVLINYAPGTTNDRIVNGPLLICDGFPSLAGTPFGEYGISSSFASHSQNEAYIFSGNICALVDYAPGTTNDKIIRGPMTIASMFPFFKGKPFENGIDACFEATATSEAYLFSGDQYALINYASPSLIAIRPITQGFGGLRNTIFQSGVEAAFASHRRDEAYLFKGEFYALINFAPGTTDDYIIGGVKEILPNWPSLRDHLPRKNRGIDVHHHAQGAGGGGGSGGGSHDEL